MTSQHLQLLQSVPAFSILSSAILQELAKKFDERIYLRGVRIIAEGEVGDAVFLIVRGRVEVTIDSPKGKQILSTLGAGELFGEIALVTLEARRTASVTALSDLTVLTLSATDFRELVYAHPDAQKIFGETTRVLQTVNFLKLATPFMALHGSRLRALAAKLETRYVRKGEIILHQGEEGEEAYFIRSGRVRVVFCEEGRGERELAVLERGALFGEAALVAGTRRNATVKTLEPTELLVLRRNDMMEVVKRNTTIRHNIIDLFHLRDRPCRIDGVQVTERSNRDGSPSYILHDSDGGHYYRLSREGFFIWERLNGKRTLKDLTLDYFEAFRKFAPHAIADIVSGLGSAGFVKGRVRDAQLFERQIMSRGKSLMELASRCVDWRVTLPQGDALISRIYRAGFYHLFRKPAQMIIAALSLLGFTAFLLLFDDVKSAIRDSERSIYFVLIPLILMAVVIHEMSHALTMKSFGQKVRGIGFGWYRYRPIFFVDMSEMWLADRWPRIAVSLAGPYANLILSGIASIVAFIAPNEAVMSLAWLFALYSYFIFFRNLNPLTECDGYYILMDAVDHPNLRSHALRWILRTFPKLLRTPSKFKGHMIELLYGAAVLGHMAFMALATIIIYRVLVEGWVLKLLPGSSAGLLAWVLAGLVVSFNVIAVVYEQRGRE